MIQTLRTLALAMMGAIVMIGLALFFVLGDEETAFDVPDTWALALVVAMGLGLNVLIPIVGYQAPAVAPGASRHNYAGAFQAAMILRLTLAESVGIISIALAFVVDAGGMLIYLIGGAISLATMAFHGYPWEGPVERFRARLERDGGTSYLREDLGLPPKLGGAIQEL